MLKRLLLSTVMLVPMSAHADLVSVSPNVTIITPPPPAVIDGNFLYNNNLPNIAIFAERKSVTLTAPLGVDTVQGTTTPPCTTCFIPTGTMVDSYLIEANQWNVITANFSATFDSPVLGIIFADRLDGYPDANFGASDFLGLPGLVYQEANCFQCGYELLPGTPGYTADIAWVTGNTANFHTTFSEPGDMARIIVRDPPPVPGPEVGAGLPGLLGLLGLWWYRRQRDATRLISPQ